MNIVVCVKNVPMTQAAEISIDGSSKSVEKDLFEYEINEWDNYAIEEAAILKEEFGGTITAITVGTEEDEEVLRFCQAMGADKAIRIDCDERELDGYVLSQALSKVTEKMEYDLILTGVQSSDTNNGVVGVMLAAHLGIPHASVVTAFKPGNGEAEINVELDGGAIEISKIKMPALLSVQTGINDPRYISITSLRNAAEKELEVIELSELGLSDDDLTPRTQVEEIYFLPKSDGAEMIEGEPEDIARKIMGILAEKGVTEQ